MGVGTLEPHLTVILPHRAVQVEDRDMVMPVVMLEREPLVKEMLAVITLVTHLEVVVAVVRVLLAD